jgi:4-hydroxyphenylpyruvate dioxygenase-like putative hemolysin
LIDNWVNTWGRGTGGIHHLAYEVENVADTMATWQAKGWLFTTATPLACDDLVQVFTQPNPITGVIYEFIERKGQHGFCKDNVAQLMQSTAHLSA